MPICYATNKDERWTNKSSAVVIQGGGKAGEERRCWFSEIGKERERESHQRCRKDGGVSAQVELHQLPFDTMTTSFRSERGMKGRRKVTVLVCQDHIWVALCSLELFFFQLCCKQDQLRSLMKICCWIFPSIFTSFPLSDYKAHYLLGLIFFNTLFLASFLSWLWLLCLRIVSCSQALPWITDLNLQETAWLNKHYM